MEGRQVFALINMVLGVACFVVSLQYFKHSEAVAPWKYVKLAYMYNMVWAVVLNLLIVTSSQINPIFPWLSNTQLLVTILGGGVVSISRMNYTSQRK